MTPAVSVVVAAHDRAERLGALLRTLEAQTLAEPFEVVVVDDASRDGTPALLEREAARGGIDLRVVRREVAGGPARARDDGWRAARAPLIAFTDDDCEAEPQWLERGVAAWRTAGARAIVQGSTGPIPREASRMSPFARTIVVDGPGPPWETCNIFFPRDVLAAIGGFDTERFPIPGGEDTDLAWRAVSAGSSVRFVPEARVHHAVIDTGALGGLRYAWHWHRTIPLFALHPELKRRQLHRGVFWSPLHERLLLALVAAALPRPWPLRLALAAPYLKRLVWRRSGALLAPYLLAYDLTEVAGVVWGGVKHRTFVV